MSAGYQTVTNLEFNFGQYKTGYKFYSGWKKYVLFIDRDRMVGKWQVLRERYPEIPNR